MGILRTGIQTTLGIGQLIVGDLKNGREEAKYKKIEADLERPKLFVDSCKKLSESKNLIKIMEIGIENLNEENLKELDIDIFRAHEILPLLKNEVVRDAAIKILSITDFQDKDFGQKVASIFKTLDKKYDYKQFGQIRSSKRELHTLVKLLTPPPVKEKTLEQKFADLEK